MNVLAIKHAFNVAGNVPILIYEHEFEINFKINLRKIIHKHELTQLNVSYMMLSDRIKRLIVILRRLFISVSNSSETIKS